MDSKLQEVLLDYGLEGYGLYWYCLELIVNKIDVDNLTFELEHDARIIARNTGSTTQKIQEMMKKFIDLGLFTNSEGRVACLKLLSRLDKSMTSNQKMRDLIDQAKYSHDSVMMNADSVMQDKKRIDKKRKDKSRPEKDINSRFTPPTFEEVCSYCAERKNTVDPGKFLNYYESVGWMRGKNKIKDWKACVRTWEEKSNNQPQQKPKREMPKAGTER